MFDATGLFSDSRLFVVGNINRDIRCAPIPRGDYLFEDGETPADFVRETAGGGAANSALAAAALGMHVAFAGKIGHDSLGERLERLLADHGIRSFLRKDAGVATGTSINLAFSTGHRHFVSCLENNRSLAFDDLDLSELGSYRHLVRGDIWFSEPMLFGGNERLFRAAKDAGLAVSIDLNWDPAWAGGDEQRIRAR